MILSVKNWKRFQHYKNRRPPWIKLYREFLDDCEFSELPDSSRALAPCIWLIASESSQGIIDLSMKALAFRVHKSEQWTEQALKPLISAGFVIDASTTLAPCYQHAIPEGEGERENTGSDKIRAVSLDSMPHFENANTGEPCQSVSDLMPKPHKRP